MPQETKDKSVENKRRPRAASGRDARYIDNRPEAAARRDFSAGIGDSPYIVAQRKQLGAIFGPTFGPVFGPAPAPAASSSTVQRVKGLTEGAQVRVKITADHEVEPSLYPATIVSVLRGGEEYEVKFDEEEIEYFVSNKIYAENLVGPILGAIPKTDVPNVDEITSVPWEQKNLALSQPVKEEAAKLASGATQIVHLSEEQIEELILVLEKEREPNSFLAELIRKLNVELEDLRQNQETEEEIDERARIAHDKIRLREDLAFEHEFGVSLQNAEAAKLEKELDRWLQKVKDSERLFTFKSAFDTNRMTARQINIGDTARGGKFQVSKLGSRPDQETDRTVFLDNTVTGVEARRNPENFRDEQTVNAKGLHDLSASILHGGPGKTIYDQLKNYKESVVLFAPLPWVTDMAIFSALARLSGVDPAFIRKVGSMMTHPKFAQSSDMGTKIVDTKPGAEGEGDFAYGLTGTVIRRTGDRARKVNKADMAERRWGALNYREVAEAGITRVNEIVMAYRHYNSEIFPMYAKWSAEDKHFKVVTADLKETGKVVTNNGIYQ